MPNYIAISALVAMAALFNHDLEAAASNAQQAQTSSSMMQSRSSEQVRNYYCLPDIALHALAADVGSNPAGSPFASDYMTANGGFFALSRLLACTSHIHRARIN